MILFLFIVVNLLLVLVLLHVKHAVVCTCLAKTVLGLRTAVSTVLLFGSGIIMAANSFLINLTNLQ